MLQKTPTALDALAELPTCRKLAQARARLEEARQASDIAAVEFREQCRKVAAADRWIRNDADASKAEGEAIRTHAAMRLATAEVEKLKQAHGTVLARHFAKHEAAALELIVEPMRDAREAARKIVQALEAGERDGASPSYQLNKAKRVLRLLNDALGSFQ